MLKIITYKLKTENKLFNIGITLQMELHLDFFFALKKAVFS